MIRLTNPRERFIPCATMLLTAGIGDFLALDSFLPCKFKKSLKTICYGTRAYKEIIELVKSFKEYENVKSHVNLFEGYNRAIPVCVSKYDVKNKLIHMRKHDRSEVLLDSCSDFSVAHMFSNCVDYKESSAICNNVSDINNKFPLPEKFQILCPYSVNNVSGRDFTKAEMEFVINILVKKLQINFVVLGVGGYKIPKNPKILNLMNRTTYLDCIEIMKKAKGYVGIDSSLSVLAPKLYLPENIIIKMSSDWTHRFRNVYYAPYFEPSFLKRSLFKAYEVGQKLKTKNSLKI